MKLLLKNGLLALFCLSLFAAGPAFADGKKGKGKDKDDRPQDSLLQTALAVNAEGPFAGAFDTLIAAVLVADPDIVIDLSKKGKRTVFAPTDDAFLALGLDATNIAEALPRDVLTDILDYHLVRGDLFAEDVLKKSRLKTQLKGRKGTLQQSGGVLIDNLDRPATIIVTDVEASNGVIHAIDSVLLPFAP